jgi:DNA-binding LacI/PurR family transcriptional regulator
MAEVARVCNDRGAGLALVSVAGGRHLAWSIESAIVDGFLLRCGGPELLVEITQRRGLPFVALSLDTEEPDVPAIDIDDFGGAREVARHILGWATGGSRSSASAWGRAGPRSPARGPGHALSSTSASARWATGPRWPMRASGEDEVPVHAVQTRATNVAEALELLFDGPAPPTASWPCRTRCAMAALRGAAARHRGARAGVGGGFRRRARAGPASRPSPPWRSPSAHRRAVGAAILDERCPPGARSCR